MAVPVSRHDLVFYVNGRKVVEKAADPGTNLLRYLRDELQLTGTKYGCGEGGCGACTVMVSQYNPNTKLITHESVYACLVPLCAVHGVAVTTVEGIGNANKLHPVQERLAKAHGSQCGFCSPGMVMSMYSLLRNNPQPTAMDIEDALEGNLCRCTGYRPILEGFQTFAKEGCCGGNCGQRACANQGEDNGGDDDVSTKLFDPKEFIPYDPSQEPIFPPELMLNEKYHRTTVRFSNNGSVWVRPTTLEELLEFKAGNPEAKLVSGNLDLGLQSMINRRTEAMLIYVTHIPELNEIQILEDGVKFGSSVTMEMIKRVYSSKFTEMAAYRLRLFASFVKMLTHFGQQTINKAGIGSHIMAASHLSDLIPILVAAGCTVSMVNPNGEHRTIPLTAEFFTEHCMTAVKSDEILLSVFFPFMNEDEYCHGYKVNKVLHRRADNVAALNAGMYVSFEDDHVTVKNMKICFGGIGSAVLCATKTTEELRGRQWNEAFQEDALRLLLGELPLSGDSLEYRRSLVQGFFFKFFWFVLNEVSSKHDMNQIPSNYQSVFKPQTRHPMQSVQSYQRVASGQLETDAVGRPSMHTTSIQQTTGEAFYCDDLPTEKGELHIAFVLSTVPHARIISVDVSKALEMEGVKCFIDASDIPGTNIIFASDKVTYIGEPIGAVLAETRVTAERAVSLVKVHFETLEAILNLEEAIEKESFEAQKINYETGNVDKVLEQSDHVMEGEITLGAQEHFYMETQSCLCRPRENDEMEIIASTQKATALQADVAKALGVPRQKITCKVKRVGGGFGGKQQTPSIFATAAAVGAKKTKKSVRLVLNRDDDMKSTTRNQPMLARYKAGISGQGRLMALDITIFHDTGANSNCGTAPGILKICISSLDQAYNIKNVRAVGVLCTTNTPPTGPFRGAGTQHGHIFTENIINDIAVRLGISQIQVRELNMYTEEHTEDHYGQRLTQIGNVRRCWEECLEKSNYFVNRKKCDHFNKENRWKKRGIAIIPTKRKVGMTGAVPSQAGALVHIYMDGSVLISHGGIEMGQGLYTKTIQVASRVLGISVDQIYINDTSTDKVPNTLCTGGTSGSDLYCHAVRIACETIKQRLEPVMFENPKESWEDWVKAAFASRINLSANGFYKLPGDPHELKKTMGYYFAYGCACSEVEVDCLTGDFEVLRTNIVMDCGDSLSPGIDIGQIEGGFMQGYGYFTMEEERRSPKNGELLTLGPGLYKIPSVKDIPQEFNVHLLKGCPNNFGIYSSKNTGEPPVFLGSAVYFAIKDALYAARADVDIHGIFRLDPPATVEKIRMACIDQFTKGT